MGLNPRYGRTNNQGMFNNLQRRIEPQLLDLAIYLIRDALFMRAIIRILFESFNQNRGGRSTGFPILLDIKNQPMAPPMSVTSHSGIMKSIHEMLELRC